MSEPVRKKAKKDQATTWTTVPNSTPHTIKYHASGNGLKTSVEFELHTDTVVLKRLEFTHLNKADILYRIALAIKDYCDDKNVNLPLPYEIRFASPSDPRFQGSECERLVQTVCSRTQLILWDPKRLCNSTWRPKCPTCTKANCVYWGWAMDVKKLIGDGEEDVWFFCSQAKCKSEWYTIASATLRCATHLATFSACATTCHPTCGDDRQLRNRWPPSPAMQSALTPNTSKCATRRSSRSCRGTCS